MFGLLLAFLAIGLVAAGISTWWLKHVWEEFVLQYVVTATVALFGSVVAKLHLRWIDPKCMAYGTMSELKYRTQARKT